MAIDNYTQDLKMLKNNKKGPLSGLIVIDLTRVLAGPYCSMILADLGARVIKVEMPGIGDDARQVGPFYKGANNEKNSAYFLSVNRNKESIALNLKSPEDQIIFEKLLSGADILIENYTPGTIERLGYGFDFLRKNHPKLILASISGFGQTGPYRELPAYDMVVQAMGGILSITGEENGRPTRVGVSIGDLAAGMFAAIGIQSAIIERIQTGVGKHVDIAMLDCQVALLENALARYQIEGEIPKPIGSRHPSITPFGVFKARDGYLVLAAGNNIVFQNLCKVINKNEIINDMRFLNNEERCINHFELKVIIEDCLLEKDVSEWMQLFKDNGVPVGPLNDLSDVVKDPQIKARGMLLDTPLPNGTKILTAGSPVKFVGAESLASLPAPQLDEHRISLLQEMGL
jgi:CoA:oxalate CoA-transferase